MRILIDYRPALRQRTGVGEYVHELAVALSQLSTAADDQLTLFSSSWKDRLPPGAVAGAHMIDRRAPVALLNLAWHRLRWPAIESLTGESFDVVQAMHPIPIPSRRAAQVVTVHDLDFLDHPERTSAEIRRDYAALAPGAVQRADRVLVNSRHTALEVERRLHVSPERISVCTPGAPAWPRRLHEPDHGYVLFFGTLAPRKNVGALLDAFGKLLSRGETGGARLVLAGGTPPEAEALIARTTQAPLAGHVNVRGYVDPAERLNLYRGAKVVVLPSHTEGFGIPALEAMTLGVPVIAANRGALPEVVGGAGRLVEPDPDDLADALRQILADRDLRHRMREAGWRQAARFSWAETAERVREAWTLAVVRRSRGRG